MDRNFETIAHEAEQMAPHDQFLLAERLVRKLGETKEHRDAWAAESQRRADAIDRGEMETVDGSEALMRIRKIVGK